MYTNKHAWTNKDGTYKEVYYYICGRNKQERGHHCDYKASLRKTDIEPLVVEAVKELVSDAYFAKEIEKRIGVQTDTSTVDKELANYENKLKEVDLNKARLENEIDNLPADARFRERKIHDMTLRLDALYDTMVELEERIEDAKLRKSSIEMEAITLDNVYKIMQNFGKLYAIISDEEKKSLITYLIKEIQIYPNGESEMPLKSIEFNFPIYVDGRQVRKVLWERGNTVESILRNEKYKGSALLQKSFTVDFLTKKTKINEGEVPQYYVEDSHPAIIEPWEWEQVQVELERRKNSRNRHHQASPFSGKIICADCGDIFGAKTWHSTDRYRRVIWQCNGKFKGERKCETPHLTEERLKELYLAALGEYLSDRDAAIDQLRYAQRMLTDTDFIDEDIQALEEELTTITGMLRLCIAENAANTMTEETYRVTHAELCNRFEETEAKLAALQKQRDKMKADAITIGGMMFELGELDTLPVTFDEKLWHGTIDHVTVHADERVVFHFKDGKEIATRL